MVRKGNIDLVRVSMLVEPSLKKPTTSKVDRRKEQDDWCSHQEKPSNVILNSLDIQSLSEESKIKNCLKDANISIPNEHIDNKSIDGDTGDLKKQILINNKNSLVTDKQQMTLPDPKSRNKSGIMNAIKTIFKF